MDYHYNGMTVQSQVSPGGGNDDPRRATARAAQMQAQAERAMESAVWKAQQEERASLFAAKRAAALRAAAEKASVAENQAARTQISAADSMESAAIRKAATSRQHARSAAYKAMVSLATSYQATADQTFAAQRAVAERSAVEAAQQSLHSMQEDTEASDRLFNDRDAARSTRHRYHDAMDNVNMNRQRFQAMHPDEDYEIDDDDDYGPPPGSRHSRRVRCAVGDMVEAVFEEDSQRYPAKLTALGPQYTVAWQDGYDDGVMVPPASVFKAGVPCGGGPGVAAAPMGAGPMVAGGMVALETNSSVHPRSES
jgi:hypothetical protein